MHLLAIDTSAAISVALLSEDGGACGTVLGQAFHDDQRQHAELLTPIIHNLLADFNLKPTELTGIAVGTGPGPFTGLRIGLVTAETLAFALGIPIYGVGSLEALATAGAIENHLLPGAEIVATLDARRKEVYWARYLWTENGLVELQSPQVTAPAEVPTQNATVVGQGAYLYGIEGAKATPRFVEAAWIGRLALERAASGIVTQPTQPLYLRRPDIQGQAPQAL